MTGRARMPVVREDERAVTPFITAAPETRAVAEPEISDSDLGNWRAELLDADSWGEILSKFGRTIKMAVALTDINGNLVGPCHNPQPVWSLARMGVSPPGLEGSNPACPFCLASHTPCNAVADALATGGVVLVQDQAGLAHAAIPLFLGKQPLGTLLAGQIFAQYPQALALRRVARSGAVSQSDLWNVAVRQVPVSPTTLHLYADLLASVGQAFLRQRYASILDRKLHETNQRYRLMVEGLNDYALFTVDSTGCVTSWNAGAERLLGYTESEVMGRDYSLFFTPEDVRSGIPQSKIRLAEQAGWIEGERWQVRKDGTRFFSEIVTARLGEGADCEYGRLLHDVTESRKSAEALFQGQKMESIGLLAAGIAHDFNNLLTGILGNVGLVTAGLPADDPRRELLGTAEKSGLKAAQLVAQLLAYAGKGEIVVTRFDLSGVVSEILPLIETSIPKTVRINLSLSPVLPWIEADASAIQQIVMNLIINGAEAIGPAGGSIHVSTGVAPINAADADPPDGVYLEVRDSGKGMDEATKRRIFDPFFTTKFTGSGLGLAAVSGIVRRLKGRLDVKSAPGEGSTFRIVFPGVPVQLPSPKAVPRAESRATGVILLVDDDPMVRNLSLAILEREGYSVLIAENGKVAVDLFRTNLDSIAAVLLDLTMPVMAGREAFRQMTEIQADIPVIISTGYGEPEDFELFNGAGGVIHKPYTISELSEKVASVLALGKTELRTAGTSGS
jgi:PAS domain S-box-containing protein